jgi:outer membrane immunogenic protein
MSFLEHASSSSPWRRGRYQPNAIAGVRRYPLLKRRQHPLQRGDQFRYWMKSSFLLTAVTFITLAAASVRVSADDKPAAIKSAADKPVRGKLSTKTCDQNWYQGWYMGLNFGGIGYTASRTDQDGQLFNVATYTQRETGFFGGAQGGYNWTTCHGFFGIEANGTAGSAIASTGLLPNSVNADVSITSRLNGVVTTRARAGIVMDSVLLYVTAGLAAAHTLTTYLNRVGDQFTFNGWGWGWVAGVGGELAVSSNISLRTEVLYVEVADRTYTFVSPTLGPGNFTHSDSAWSGRVGLNVKLGFDPAMPTY